MKHELDHLPPKKVRELERLLKVLFEAFDAAQARRKERGEDAAGKILKVILFGSYARGGWVEDRVSGYFSDYDILVIVDQPYLADVTGFWHQAEFRLLNDPNFQTPVNIISHTLDEVNENLQKGQYFFTDIKDEGIALYELPGYTLRHAEPLSTEDALKFAQKYYDQWMPSAAEFLEYFEFGKEKGNLKSAVFQLHQAAERAYHCFLLVLTNYSPPTHNLNKLRKLTETRDKRLRSVFPSDNKIVRRRYQKLRRAYVEARYSEHYEITAEELAWLGARVKKLHQIVAQICEERLAVLKNSL